MSHSNRYDLVRRGIPSKVDKDKIFSKDINILIKCVPFVSEESVEKALDVDSKNIYRVFRISSSRKLSEGVISSDLEVPVT
jgi:hypothetical protein